MKKITEQMLGNGIIKHSTSPIILVKKTLYASDKQKWRLVVDFRRLNEVTEGDSYPLPLTTEILDTLGKAKYYTTLECASGSYQIPLRKQDRAKTAFSTATGHYEFCNLPMGLKLAPATFQRLMNTIMPEINGIKTLIYMDDLIVIGATLEDHNMVLVEVFDRLRTHNLKIHPDKCEFLRTEVCYLGHTITADGVKPDGRKVQAV